MPKRDSPVDLVGHSRRPCSCGWDPPPTDAPLWYLIEWDVLHRAHHRGDAKPHTFQQWKEYAQACAAAIDVLQGSRKRLRTRICDLEEELASTQFDLQVTRDLVEDLKADLAAVEEGRHA